MFLVWFASFTLICIPAQAANILVFLPLESWSHYMQYEPLYETLATRGHHITVYSPYPPEQNLTNFTHVYISNQAFLEDMANFEPFKEFYDMEWFLVYMYQFFAISSSINQEILKDSTFHKLINSKQSFDLVMVEPFFLQELTVILGHIFKAPVINMGATGPNPNMLEAMGSPNQVTFMPEIYSYLSDQMTFVERVQNLHYTTIRYVFRQARNWYLDRMVEENLGPGFPPVDSLLRNISFCFLYSAAALEYSRPMTQNMVQLGGIHIQRNKSLQLPEDLQQTLDGATHGFILFSLGSVIKPTSIPPSLAHTLKTAFSRLGRYKIVWKWSGEPLLGLPSNVVQLKWVPQIPVLAHPNCKLFITHGGLSSQLETVYFGVPVVTIPFFGDQFSSATKAVDFGFGVYLRNTNLTSDSLVWSVSEVLSNQRYKRKAMERSQLLRDSKRSPLDEALFWTEYVIQFKGAVHLSPVSRQLYWYQYYLLDVLAFIVAVLVGVVIAGKILIKTVLAKKKNIKDKRKENNKRD